MIHTCPNCGAAMTGPGKLEARIATLTKALDTIIDQAEADEYFPASNIALKALSSESVDAEARP